MFKCSRCGEMLEDAELSAHFVEHRSIFLSFLLWDGTLKQYKRGTFSIIFDSPSHEVHYA